MLGFNEIKGNFQLCCDVFSDSKEIFYSYETKVKQTHLFQETVVLFFNFCYSEEIKSIKESHKYPES